jgi:hypothetical protein
MNWTDLPGPTAFIALVEQDLRDSKSVLAVLPGCFDDQWLYSIRSRLEGCYEWQEVPSTLEGFYQDVSCRHDGQPFVDIREMIEHRITGRGFILRDPPLETWSNWMIFMRSFAELNRGLPEVERNVFVIVTEKPATKLPNEPLLSERRIEGIIRTEDAFFYAARNMDINDDGHLWRKIRIHVASELAVWDFHLCDGLCELPVRKLLDPIEWLRDYSERQGWAGDSENPVDHEKIQRAGLLFSVDGEEMTHSGLLALQGKRDEIERRIWIAQVRVLFPVIEEQRIRLINTLRRIHASTINRWECELDDDEELEIGVLYHRMVTSRIFGMDLTRLAEKLKNVRNNLAHLKICEPRDLPGDHEWLK